MRNTTPKNAIIFHYSDALYDVSIVII